MGTWNDKDGEGNGRDDGGHVDDLRLHVIEEAVDNAEGDLEETQNDTKDDVSGFKRIIVVELFTGDTSCLFMGPVL